jgi:hypothetical protein
MCIDGVAISVLPRFTQWQRLGIHPITAKQHIGNYKTGFTIEHN